VDLPTWAVFKPKGPAIFKLFPFEIRGLPFIHDEWVKFRHEPIPCRSGVSRDSDLPANPCRSGVSRDSDPTMGEKPSRLTPLLQG
jgi:hypothetical protein